MTSLVDTWISQASAKQRAGRAGRVREGFCFRLFTRSRYGDMHAFTTPEIQRVPLEDLCLHLLATKTGHPVQVLSHALDPPKRSAVLQALETLRRIEAAIPSDSLDDDAVEGVDVLAATKAKGRSPERLLAPLTLTPLGRCLANLPLDVHLGKMLVMATLLDCLEPALTIAAALSYQLPFVAPFDQREAADKARIAFDGGSASDLIAVARAFAQWRALRAHKTGEARRLESDFCRRHYLSATRLHAIDKARHDLRRTLSNIGFASAEEGVATPANSASAIPASAVVPDAETVARLRCVILAGLYPQVACAEPPKTSRAHAPPLALEGGASARFHPSSALHPSHRRPWMTTRHVAFAEKMKTSQVG
jgi:HrpA-like RNA helicase